MASCHQWVMEWDANTGGLKGRVCTLCGKRDPESLEPCKHPKEARIRIDDAGDEWCKECGSLLVWGATWRKPERVG